MHFPPVYYHPQQPAARRRGPGAGTWFLLAACLLVWPAVFATAVVATFATAAIYFDDPGGPLFWPIAWVVSGIVYSLFVGLPIALCALRRRWYLRLIPAVIAVVPVLWLTSMAGAWSIPATATVALSILVETTGWRHKWTMKVWGWLTALGRRP